jgi:hypothetical protein
MYRCYYSLILLYLLMVNLSIVEVPFIIGVNSVLHLVVRPNFTFYVVVYAVVFSSQWFVPLLCPQKLICTL